MIPVELIRQQNFNAIVDWSLALTEDERINDLHELQKIDPRDAVFAGVNVQYALMLTKVVHTRSFNELKRFPALWPAKQTLLHSLLSSRNSVIHDALVRFYLCVSPDYLDRVVMETLSRPETGIDFRLLWRFHEHGWVAFDEGAFASALFHVEMFTRSVSDELSFLRDHPQVIKNVLLTFCQHDVPVLLRSKWLNSDGQHYCGIVTEFWDEIFAQLHRENRLPRCLITSLLASLILNFKKGRLDWHIRLIKLLDPGDDEWMACQNLLVAAFYASNPTVVNFAIQSMQKISQLEHFDHAAFMQHLQAITGREKCDKALLIALNIADMLTERFPQYRASLAQMVSGALIQSTEKIQLRAAELMLKYHTAKDIAPLVEPYLNGLKNSVTVLLQSAPPLPVVHTLPALDFMPVVVPESWDALLFHTGKMLAGREAIDIELFYAGVIARQDEIPADYKKQMQPYFKKLMKPYLSSTLLYSLRDFIHQWLTGTPASAPEIHERRFPHLLNQNRLVLERLRNRCRLSLLATPTHTPFYVSPQALVERLLAHEQSAYPVDVDDLIVACNRLLPGSIPANVKQQALMLQGDYARAVHYLLGMTDDISAANNALLPLWTQITRTRNAKGVYPQYQSLAADIAAWPAIVEPFHCAYRVIVDKGEHWTWYRLMLNNRTGWRYEAAGPYADHYYYLSLNCDNCCSKADFLYCMSLVPHYVDIMLQYVIPGCATGNEVQEIEDCFYPLTFLLENQLRVHDGGWIYIAVCLLFEKKASRDLAADYIQLALQQGFIDQVYLSECIAYLLMHKFAPINRFIDYLDNHNGDPAVKAFQHQILTSCVNRAKDGDVPTNYKKLVAWHKEYQF